MRGLRVSVRAGAAAGLALALAEFMRLTNPVLAMIAAVIVTDLSPADTRRLGAPRLIGTVIGAALGATAAPVLGSAPAVIAFGIMTAMFATHLVGIPAAARLSGYLCGLVLLSHDADRWAYAGDRLLETIVGVGMAVLVSVIPFVIPARDTRFQGAR